jgi:hypothetical protein
MIKRRTYTQDPSAVLDYTIDWSQELAGDSILTSTWTAPVGIVIDHTEVTASTATVWLTGGTVGSEYEVKNHITTNGGRVDERSLWIRIQQQ